jgi:NAD-dependent DNA ligase
MKNVTNTEWLKSIYGIGEKTIENVRTYFEDKDNMAILEQLEAVGINMDPQKYNNYVDSDEAKGNFSIT